MQEYRWVRLLWTSAVTFAMLGKFTGGGSRDYRINKQREQNTGWQPILLCYK